MAKKIDQKIGAFDMLIAEVLERTNEINISTNRMRQARDRLIGAIAEYQDAKKELG